MAQQTSPPEQELRDLPLPALFQRARGLLKQLDTTPASDPSKQRLVADGAACLQAAAAAADALALFSANEDRDDLATGDIKYLLIPFYQAEVASHTHAGETASTGGSECHAATRSLPAFPPPHSPAFLPGASCSRPRLPWLGDPLHCISAHNTCSVSLRLVIANCAPCRPPARRRPLRAPRRPGGRRPALPRLSPTLPTVRSAEPARGSAGSRCPRAWGRRRRQQRRRPRTAGPCSAAAKQDRKVQAVGLGRGRRGAGFAELARAGSGRCSQPCTLAASC